MVVVSEPRMTSVAERQAKAIAREQGVVVSPVSRGSSSASSSSAGGGGSPTPPPQTSSVDPFRFPKEMLGSPEVVKASRVQRFENPYGNIQPERKSVADRFFSSVTGGRFSSSKSDVPVSDVGVKRVDKGMAQRFAEFTPAPKKVKDVIVRAGKGVDRGGGSFVSGFQNMFKREESGRDLRTMPLPYQVGKVGGIVGSVVGAGSYNADKVTSVTRRGLSAIDTGFRGSVDAVLGKVGLGGGVFGKYVGSGVAGAVEGEGILKVGRGVARRGGDQGVRSAFKVEGFEDAFSRSMYAQEKKNYGDAWYKGVLQELSPVGNKGEFVRVMRDEGGKLGLKGSELDDFVSAGLRQRTASQWVEPIQIVNWGRLSERIGRAGVSESFDVLGKKGVTILEKESFGKLFGVSGAKIGIAGTLEGGGQEFSQQRSRNKPLDINKILGMSALGGATASVIGGSIVGTSVRKPATSRTINFLANVVDPSEKPGDLLADFQEAGIKRLGVRVPSPSISVSGKRKGGVISFGGSDIISFGKSKSNVPVKSKVTSPAQLFQSVVGSPSSVTSEGGGVIPTVNPVPANNDVVVNPFSDVFAPVSVNSNIPASVPVGVNSNIFSFTPTPVSVVVPNPRLPPPLPFGFDLGGGGAGRGGGKGRRKYVDELSVGRGLLFDMLGGQRKVVKPKVKSKRVSIKDGGKTYSIIVRESKVKKMGKGVAPFEMMDMYGVGKKLGSLGGDLKRGKLWKKQK